MTAEVVRAGGGGRIAPAEDLLNVTIDDVAVQVPKGTLIIRAAEAIGVAIPRFCDHPLLAPVAACRMCLVEIEGQPKPQPSCAVTVADGMVVRTQHSSVVAADAQYGVMEFLLLNHPLDCPVCDKGGECPLQNQAMANGRGETRFDGPKRQFPKPIPISAQVLLDRERCVQCARCTRFADEIAGDPFIDLFDRGSSQQVGTSDDQPFDSYFSGNTIQICPVGALTSASYRFRSRPFDLVSVPTVCEHCAVGCSLRTDVRRGQVQRRLAADAPDVNEEWNCDKGRFAFTYTLHDRIETPMVRDDGQLRTASWPEAIDRAARAVRASESAAVLTGGRLTVEDAYAYAKFARVVLRTDDVDFRARAASGEERHFLTTLVAGRTAGPTMRDLEAAPAVVIAGLDVEEEAPVLLLRLRKGDRPGREVYSVAPYLTTGSVKLGAALLPTVPGDEAAVLESLADPGAGPAAAALRRDGAVLVVGERLATVPGALSAAARLAESTGAVLVWVPRRAGERGSLEAGLLAGLLPGGRPLADPVARAEVARAWGLDDLPVTEPGRDLSALLEASTMSGAPDLLVLAGVGTGDVPDRAGLTALIAASGTVIAFEQRHTDVTAAADVVFPVAAAPEKAGTFVNLEGRWRPFPAVFRDSLHLSDARVLELIAAELDLPFGSGEVAALRAELTGLGRWAGERDVPPSVPAGAASHPGAGEAVLATWRMLLDDGTLQVGEPHLAATSRPARAVVSTGLARGLGVREGESVRISSEHGGFSLPVAIVADAVDGVVWVPANSADSHPLDVLGVGAGAVVSVAAAGSAAGAMPVGTSS